MEPEKEEGEAFRGAITVHPVAEPTLMYRLHKRYSRIQLERAYEEIERLQVGGGRDNPGYSLVQNIGGQWRGEGVGLSFA